MKLHCNCLLGLHISWPELSHHVGAERHFNLYSAPWTHSLSLEVEPVMSHSEASQSATLGLNVRENESF